MSQRRPTTIYLDPKIAKAAKIKAAVSGRSLSDIANEGISLILQQDAAKLKLIRERMKDRAKARPYEEFIEELRRNGQI